VRGRLAETPALVVRLVDRGESDRLVTLLTENSGLVSVSARGVRKGSKRYGGVLEPMHRLVVTVEHPEREIARLEEARVDAMRLRITEHLEASLAAGFWLRFARVLAHPHGDDRALFRVLDGALDLLDATPVAAGNLEHLVPFAMLAAVGYALELDACVSCGKPCPSERPSGVDGRRGGLLCRACGYASTVLTASQRATVREAQAGAFVETSTDDRVVFARLAQDVVVQHVGRTVR
jgi:DNA repair protein RecO (recombination protein O)